MPVTTVTPEVSVAPRPAEVAAAALNYVTLSNLRWIALDSSSIAAVAYHGSTETLYVQMISSVERIYAYLGVPAEKYVALTTAKSAGAYYVKSIRNDYETVKVSLAVAAVPA